MSGGRPTREQSAELDWQSVQVYEMFAKGIAMLVIAKTLGISVYQGYRRRARHIANLRKDELARGLAEQEKQQARELFRAHYGGGARV